MSRIIGNETVLKRITEARAGDPSVYINLEAIAQLPDDYESVVVKVDFDINNDFTNVGTENNPSWYPKPPLMARIAEARGITIDGINDETVSVFENINISSQEMVQNPVIQNRKVGYSVKKTGSVIMEDGTIRQHSESSTENAWEEAEFLWTKEEMYSEGYTKPSKYPPKYDNKWKRRLHFQELLDKAEGKARTNAFVKIVRMLACLKTGYKTEELKEGCFYFAKIRRSEMIRKAETAARLSALSAGHEPAVTKQLFGETDPVMLTHSEPATTPEPISKRAIFIETLETYRSEGIVPSEMNELVGKLLSWLKATENAEESIDWQTALQRLKGIETMMDAGIIKQHGLY